MDSKTSATKSGVTRPKLVLIGVLAVVLVGVLYLQFGRPGAAKPKAAASRERTAPARRERPGSRRPKPRKTQEAPQRDEGARRSWNELRPWKVPDLATVMSYDPFALPDAFPKPQSPEEAALAARGEATDEDTAKKQAQLAEIESEKREELAKLRQQGVTVVVKGRDKKYVALIGDQELRVGDEINGFTIVSIDPQKGVDLIWQGQ